LRSGEIDNAELARYADEYARDEMIFRNKKDD
jgi:hypothetical protein